MKNEKKAELILALDVDTLESAEGFLNNLYPQIKIFKVGSQLFTAYGPKVIELVHKKGAEVFLDLKYFDIPNTVALAVRAAARLKVKMLTLHISGGKDMLKAAVAAADEEAKISKTERPLLIGVTILTSKEAKISEVLNLAKMGIESGLNGVVCSSLEIPLLKEEIKGDFVIVTPGIRSAKTASDDQKRTATAAQAVKAGSDFLVVGRQVLKAANPVVEAKEILAEIKEACCS